MRGILALLVISIWVGVGALGYKMSKSIPVSSEPPKSVVLAITDAPKPTPPNIPWPTPTHKPVPVVVKIECIGPDGVHFQTTQKECDALNKAWEKPTPTPTTYVYHYNYVPLPTYSYPTYAPIPTINVPTIAPYVYHPPPIIYRPANPGPTVPYGFHN